MTYINPFDLFDITSSQPAVVRDALSRKVEVLKKSNQEVIIFNGVGLNQAKLVELAKELAHPERAAFHKFILTHPRLYRFLTTGDSIFWHQYQSNPLFENKKFQAFVAPFFAQATAKIVVPLFEAADHQPWQHFISCPLVMAPSPDAPFWQQLTETLLQQVRDLRKLLQQVRWNKLSGSIQAGTLFPQVMANFSVQRLNALPKSFDDTRGQIATLWSDWAYLLFERFPLDQYYFYQLIRAAHQLEVRPAVRTRLQEDLQELAEKLSHRRAHRAKSTTAILKNHLRWVRQVKAGILFQQTSPERMSQLLTEQLLPEELVTLKGPEALHRQLGQELVALALTFWLRMEDKALFAKTMQLSAIVAPPTKEQKTHQHNSKLTLCSATLLHMKSELRQQMPAGIALEEANKRLRLLHSLLDDGWLQQLSTIEHTAERRAIFKLLVPVAHQLRRYNPVGVVRLLDRLDPIIRKDAMLRRMTDPLNDRIEWELEQEKWKAPGKGKNRTKVPHRDPLDRVTPAQQMGDALLRVRAFFMNANTTGPHRLVYLAMLVVLTGSFGLASLGIGTFLAKPHAVQIEHPDYLKFVNDRAYKAPKFIRERSKYVGNQLNNGATPYQRCFEEGTYDFGSENALTITNQLPEDAVLALYDLQNKRVVRHQYLRTGQQTTLYHLPQGEYTTKFYVGKDWNPLKPNFCGTHGAFDTNPHYLKRSRKAGPLSFETKTKEQIVLGAVDGPGILKVISISASNFFYQQTVSWPPGNFED